MDEKKVESEESLVGEDVEFIEDDEDGDKITSVNSDLKRKTLTLFLLFFPSLLIAAIPMAVNSSYVIGFGLKGCLIFYQFVVIKNFIDNHYD